MPLLLSNRLFKLLRLTRLKYVILALQKKFPKSVYFTTFIELFLYFFLFAHWTGCIFFSIAYGMADPHGNDYEQHLFLNGWVHLDGLLGRASLAPPPLLFEGANFAMLCCLTVLLKH